MAYSTSNPPNLKVARNFSTDPALWVYVSADAHTDVDATDYFSDGSYRGMKVNDIVFVVDTAGGTCTMHRVSAVTAGGAATVAAATLA